MVKLVAKVDEIEAKACLFSSLKSPGSNLNSQLQSFYTNEIHIDLKSRKISAPEFLQDYSTDNNKVINIRESNHSVVK